MTNNVFFGEISSQKMEMNITGKIVAELWHEIPKHFPFAKLNSFVVMPNHVHGILVIDNPENILKKDIIPRDSESLLTPTTIKSSNIHEKTGGITGDHNIMNKKNVARVMRWYKGRCTYEIRKSNPKFEWQPKFYDIIIRNHRAFQNILQYIIDNPKKWNQDKFKPQKSDLSRFRHGRKGLNLFIRFQFTHFVIRTTVETTGETTGEITGTTTGTTTGITKGETKGTTTGETTLQNHDWHKVETR